MRIKGIRVLLAAAALFCTAAAANADIKVKSRNTFSGQPGQNAPATESTIYIKGKRQRAENEGGTANITQCDLRRTVQLNGATKTYIVSSWDMDGGGAAPTQAASAGRAEPARKGGVITSTINATDTGERKQMFGYTARRIKTSMITESSPDACQQTKTRIDSDGWYIDLAVEFDCYDKSVTAYNASGQTGGCRDRYSTRQTGAAKLGYPVMVTTTMYDDAGRPSFTFTQEVLEISKATLDAALFDVPAGYREVKDATELYTGMASSGSDSDDDDDAGASSGLNGASGMTSTGANNMRVNVPSTEGALSVGPKQPGIVRVGVAMTKATASEGIDANTLAEAVRNTLVNSLRGPSVEIVTLDARVPMQIESEARQKECDYVVYTTVAHKKGSGGGGGGFGGFLKKAAPVADVVSVGGMTAGNTGGAVAAGVATTGIYTAAGVAGSVKSKDELTLDYILQRAGTAVVSNKLKAKARSDGEDLITGLVEQVASVVRNQAAGR